MSKYKNKIIAGAAAVLILILAFAWGGNYARLGSVGDNEGTEKVICTSAPAAKTQKNTQAPKPSAALTVDEKPKATDSLTADENEQPSDDKQPMTAEEKIEAAAQIAEEDLFENEYSEEFYTEEQKYNASDELKLSNSAKTEDEEIPEPADLQNVIISDRELRCTLSVRCDTIWGNITKLDSEKTELVPNDGIIFAEQTVIFYEGETVFNVLLREMKKNKIHFEFKKTPIYNSAYIEGIGNIYELDCGELSGWMYRVNGRFLNYSCSRYRLKDGDNVEILYTCSLGADIGGFGALEGQKDE